ncbi:hypothetical protein [Shewanella zhangzhouensis]|uniref:hypothetical protein n=1 Tax=Shewanella zhangzhouensis TaxID=2864213 RepID=UPI001C65F786|nr:hypothetical protein [Shewanella zhangzhouensis]QYK06381.1 hypothetical protein K0H63_06060 [Shewanella zhangzhouensis]
MNDSQLRRALQSVGMSCFVNSFDLFQSGRYSKDELIEWMSEQNDFTENSCKSRVNHALRIFRENKHIESLKLIKSSARVDSYTKLQAAKLHAQLTIPAIDIAKEPLIIKLMGFKSRDINCKKVYCTTCGGLSAAIDKSIDQALIYEIMDFISNHAPEELYLYGDWYDYLTKYAK